MSDLNRSLSVFADGLPIFGFRRAYLSGCDALGLYPMPFILRLWNLADSDYHALRAAKYLSVRHDDSILAYGKVSDVYMYIAPEGKITETVFAAGLGLWEAPVSLSVEAGVSVSNTVRRILEASRTGISLLSFPGEDPVRSRAQAFYGRAAECIEIALTAANVRGYLTESGLCIVPTEQLPVSIELSSEDLLSDPVFVGSRQMLLRTRITGWPLGKAVRVKWKDGSQEGLVLERSVSADNLEGEWKSELLMEVSL
jgi:hypothetical protein